MTFGLPPIDIGGYLDFQRKRMQQEAQQAIQSAGATATDWVSRAQNAVQNISPQVPGVPDLSPGTPDLSAVDNVSSAVRSGLGQVAGQVGQGIGNVAQGIGQTFRQGQALNQATGRPDPLAQLQQGDVRGALFGNGPGQPLQALERSTVPGVSTAATALANQVGSMQESAGRLTDPERLAALGRLGLSTAMFGTGAYARAGELPGGGPVAPPLEALQAGGDVLNWVPGMQVPNYQYNLGKEAAKEAGLPWWAQEAAGLVSPVALEALGSRAAEAAPGLIGRLASAPEEDIGAMAGRGGRQEASRFGIPTGQFHPGDVEGQAMAGATGTVDDLRALPGAPGSRGAIGNARVNSARAMPEEIAANTVGQVDADGVRTAATPYEYLKGMAQDYAQYRNFYPDFGRFYRSLSEPAGQMRDQLFNELGALWGATAAQTAPHDNLIKAIQSSIAARRWRQVLADNGIADSLPNRNELFHLLKTGEVAPGVTYERVPNPDWVKGGAQPATIPTPAEGTKDLVIGTVPEAQLKGSAAKITMDDAQKISDVWNKGTIDIPTNFKLTAFNLLNALAARNEHAPWSVIDTHMFRLFGYAQDAAGKANLPGKVKAGDLAGNPIASRYIQAVVGRLADELGWEPHQVQSALWYGAKNEVSPVSVKRLERGLQGPALDFAQKFEDVAPGARPDDGTLAYSIAKAWPQLEDFLQNHAPSGPINDASGNATVRFTGPLPKASGSAAARSAVTGEPLEGLGSRLGGKAPGGGRFGTFRLGYPEQEGANAWAENRGYTTTVDASPEEMRALGYDPATGQIAALAERNIPHAVTQNPDGTRSVQLFTRSDEPARAAQGLLRQGLGEARVPAMIRPILPGQAAEEASSLTGTGTAFQIDKAGGGKWLPEEIKAARDAGLPLHVSPDGESLVVRPSDLGPDVKLEDVTNAMELAGAPKLDAQEVPVRELPDLADYAASGGDRTVNGTGPTAQDLGITPSRGAGVDGTDGLDTGLGAAWRQTLRAMGPAGQAASPGQQLSDIAGAGLGAAAGWQTAPEDADWQERAKRAILGASAGALAGPAARRSLGLLAEGAPEAAGLLPRTAQGGVDWGKVGASDIPEIMSGNPLMGAPSLLANATSGVARTLQRALGSSISHSLTGHPMDAVADIRGMLQELPGAAGRFASNVAAGPSPRAPGMTGAPARLGMTERSGLIPAFLSGGTRLNSATDAFWRDINEAGARAAGERAAAGGRTPQGGVDAMARRAGDYATWGGPNTAVAKKLTEFKNMVHDPSAPLLDRVGAGLVTALAPYVMMPERLLRAAVGDTVPVGNLAGAVRAGAKGDKVAMQEALGRAAAGGAVTSFLVGKYLAGDLVGDAPQDPKERLRREAQGTQWNTIDVGGVKVPTRYFGSAGMQADAIATTMEAAQRANEKSKGDLGSTIEGGFNAAAKWMLDQSYLADTSSLINAVEKEGAAGGLRQVAAGLPSRVTAPITSPINALDPYERVNDTFPQMVANRTGLRALNPVRIDPATGQPQMRAGSGWSRFWGQRGDVQSDQAQELARLGLQPRAFSKNDTYANMRQTPDAIRALQQAYGSETARAVREAMDKPGYDAMPDDQKKRALQDALNTVSGRADVVLGDNVARDAKAQAQREWDAVPKWAGVTGSDDQVRARNAEIARAHTLADRYKKDATPIGGTVSDSVWRNKMRQDDPDAYKLLSVSPASPTTLASKKRAIEAKYNLKLT